MQYILILRKIPFVFSLCALIFLTMIGTVKSATTDVVHETPSDTLPMPPLADTSEKPETIGELWTGSLYSSTYKAGVCIASDGAVRGVLHLRLKGGQVDTYHFYGQQSADGRIKAKHSSGHRFEGYFINDHIIKGNVRTKGGFSVKLEGKREQGVVLTDSCGPVS